MFRCKTLLAALTLWGADFAALAQAPVRPPYGTAINLETA